jgi:transposase-like protein
MELLASQAAIRRELKKRENKGGRDWRAEFHGRPREFMGEIVGPEWYDLGYAAWRAFVATVFGQPLLPDEMVHYRSCTGKENPPSQANHEAWLAAGRRGGKALALDTPIPTPDGWTTMGSLKMGDIVYDENGQPTRVTDAFPVMHGRPCYRVIFSDNSSIVADGEHLWTTLTARTRKARGRVTTEGKGRRWSKEDRDELLRLRQQGVSSSVIAAKFGRTRNAVYQAFKQRETYTLPPTQSCTFTTEEIRKTLYVSRKDGEIALNHSIDCCAALQGQSCELPVDPYLLGCWLGDGHSNASAITTADREIVASFEAQGYRANKWKNTSNGKASTYGIIAGEDGTFVGRLKTAGVFGNKHVPSVYLRVPFEERLALLQGLMDTDGYCDARGHCEFTSIKEDLARGVREIALSLGFKACISESRANIKGRDISAKYRVTFIAHADCPVFRLPRKFSRQLAPGGKHSAQSRRRYIVSVEPVESVPVRCISVDSPSSLYLAGDAMIPTHNSRVLSLITAYLAVCFDWTPYLVPGERGHIVVLAAQTKQAGIIMGYVKAIFADPRFLPLVEKNLSDTLDLAGQIRIEIVTASVAAVRSRTVVCALLDEIAFWRSDEAGANPDAEVLNALRPAMATIPGAVLLAASSPYARRGVLWDQYSRYYSKPAGPLIWKAPTWVMNPTVPQQFLDEERERDPVAYEAEYGAEFRSDVAAFMSKEALDAVVVKGRFEVARAEGVEYFGFVDPSGGMSDSMTLAIAHREGDVAALDLILEIRPPFDTFATVETFAQVLLSYGIVGVEGDHWGGDFVRQPFRNAGIAYEVSARTKGDIYQSWLPLINAGRARLLDNTRLYNQALQLERRTSRGGRDSVDHPPMGHDDVVNVAAGAMVMAAGQRYPSLWTPDAMPTVE